MQYECIWDIKHTRNNEVIWSESKKNMLVDSGEKALVDTFFRNNGDLYFTDPTRSFFVGLANGVFSESTTLFSIPNEPAGNGYTRLELPKSIEGWPIIEQHNGDWRVVSKELELEAVSGSIGPVNAAFLCTSRDTQGALIGVLPLTISRTILDGDKFVMQLRVKIK